MHPPALLRDLVLLVAAAIPVVLLAHRFRIPQVAAYLLAGLALGPHGLGLIRQAASVAQLAELGVLLLLFTIGLELSLSRIARLGRAVWQGGGLQVSLTAAAVTASALAARLPGKVALLAGALVALSSTAIVLKLYSDRGELDTPYGRVVVGVLLFQDLCVVPLMLALPFLAGAAGPGGVAQALRDFALSLAVLSLLVVGGRLLVPRLLERVVAVRNREIFTLSIVLFGVGSAYLTASFGLSLAIGAFIAGLVIAESAYGLQALSDVLPFRDTFSGIFFISVGMSLDLGYVAHHPWAAAGAAGAVILLKTGIATLAAATLGRSWEVSLASGLALAQVGEFSFVLAGAAAPLGLLPPEPYQLFLSAAVTSMLAAPFLIASAPALAGWIARRSGRTAGPLAPEEARDRARLEDHTIIVGYGLNGRNLARVLRAAGIPYVILEQNGQVIRQARLAREPILFGDGTSHEVLERVAIARARVIVFAISAPAAERRGVAVARSLNPTVRIIVRTRYVAAIEELRRAGADEVVPEEFETSVEIFARVLRLYGVPSNTIEREVQAVRGEHYGLFRGLALPDLKLDALRHLGVHAALDTVEVESGSPAVGESPASLHLRRRTGATLIAAVRDGRAHYTPDPAFRFRPGDVVVLVGERSALDQAIPLFRAPSAGAPPA